MLQAWSHALLGDGERALQVMDQALELRGPIATASGYAIVLQVLGREDEALREHPRFRAIRQGMGL